MTTTTSYIPDPDFSASRVNTLVDLAESRLREAIYQDESRDSTFDKSAKTHLDQEVEGLVRHGYSGIDPRTKVRHLMNGIKLKELLPVQTQIFSTPALQTDFQAVVDLYKMTINSMKPSGDRRTATVAAASTSMGDDGDADMSIDDRYYTHSEYNRLTRAQKNGLRLKRKSRGHKPTSKRTTSDNKGKGKRVRFAKGDAKVFADKVAPRVASMVKSLIKSEDESSADDDDSDSDNSSSGNKSSCLKNRNNKALKRRGSKKGKK